MNDRIKIRKAIELVLEEQFKGQKSSRSFHEISIPARRNLDLSLEMQSYVDKLVREYINQNPNYSVWMRKNTLKPSEGGTVNLNNLFTEMIRRN